MTGNNRFVTVPGANPPVSGVLPPIVTTAPQIDPVVGDDFSSRPVTRVVADGKFLLAGGERFLAKGVTYGTFAPDAQGYQLPHSGRSPTIFG